MADKKKRVEFSPDVTAKDLELLETLERLAAEKRVKSRTQRHIKRRSELLAENSHPALLAKHLEPGYVITPAVELVSKKLRETLDTYSGRLVVAVPPQEMKSTLLRWLCFWTLLQNPEKRIVFASYAASLARQSGRIVRAYTEIYGEEFGLEIDQAHRDAADWQLAGHIGGLFCTGVGGSLTGKPADCVVGLTHVTTSVGPMRIDELHARVHKPLVASWDGTGIRWNRVLASRDVGVRPCVEVVTGAGRSITCTDDHLIHSVDRGWVAAGQLHSGERIHVGASMPWVPEGVLSGSLEGATGGEEVYREAPLLRSELQEQAPLLGDADVCGMREGLRAPQVRGGQRSAQGVDRVFLSEVMPVGYGSSSSSGASRTSTTDSRLRRRNDSRRDSTDRNGKASVLRRGAGTDRILSSVRQSCEATRPDMRTLLSEGSGINRGYFELRVLQQRNQANACGTRETQTQGSNKLLLSRSLHGKFPCRAERVQVQGMRYSYASEGQRDRILFTEVPESESRSRAGSERETCAARENLSAMWGAVSADEHSEDLLHESVRGRRSLGANDRQGQQSVQGRHQLRRVVQADAPADLRPRRLLPSLRRDPGPENDRVDGSVDRQVPADRASHRRTASEQRSEESDLAMSRLSHDPPQVDVDTVAVVRRLRGTGERVYDIQVERDSNFFGNEVLVHNCLIIDDPTRNQADADSPTIRENLMEWWSAVARTRLAPGAPVITVQTRWSINDLAGTLISEGWPVINIPAVADGITDDALNRPPGEYLESTRGRTPDDWQGIEREVGPRTWNALFMGRPVPLEGGVFKQHWFDDHRVEVGTEPWLREIVVGVDPAETGTGDEAGIIVAGLSLDGQLWILDDASAMYSQEAWGRAACLAWLRWGANRIVEERNLGMGGTIATSWSLLRRQAVAVVGYGIEGAAKVLADGGDFAAASIGQLREIAPYAEEIVDAGTGGPREVRLTPKQSKIIRAESATQPFETGRAHLVGKFPKLEHQAVTFNASTSDSPDRVDCLALVVHHLSRGAGSSRILV